MPYSNKKVPSFFWILIYASFIVCIIIRLSHLTQHKLILTFNNEYLKNWNLEFSKFVVKKLFTLIISLEKNSSLTFFLEKNVLSPLPFFSKEVSAPPPYIFSKKSRWSRPGYPINFDPSLSGSKACNYLTKEGSL